jgi:negative regulator of sigma E activity
MLHKAASQFQFHLLFLPVSLAEAVVLISYAGLASISRKRKSPQRKKHPLTQTTML